jgi:hypothetical protein
MDSLLKAIGHLLYIILFPLFLITEGLVALVQYLNYSFVRLHYIKAKHKKQVANFIKQHRHHLRWNLQRPGWLK